MGRYQKRGFRLIGLAALGLALPFAAGAQQANATFAAATIKPVAPDSREPIDFRITTGRLAVSNLSLTQLVREAYDPRPQPPLELRGVPHWLDSTHVDVAATADGPANAKQIRAMLRTLLEDRLALRISRKFQPGTVYTLRVQTPGKLHRAAGDEAPGGISTIRLSDRTVGPDDAAYKLVGKNVTMAALAARLSGELDQHPVEDSTGLTAGYDFDLTYGNGAAIASAPSLARALEDQMGLRLTTGKGPIPYLDIDHIVRPAFAR